MLRAVDGARMAGEMVEWTQGIGVGEVESKLMENEGGFGADLLHANLMGCFCALGRWQL
jgi:hypothetical protein